jgi:hypothetical protein
VLNQNAEVRDEASPELAAKLAFWERVRAEFPYDVIRGLYKVGVLHSRCYC